MGANTPSDGYKSTRMLDDRNRFDQRTNIAVSFRFVKRFCKGFSSITCNVTFMLRMANCA